MVGRALLAVLFAPVLCSAQQVVEINYSAGRTIIDDELRGMRPNDLAVDWERSLIYVNDAEEPNGIMVFSLETGEWVRTIATPRGYGPFEFSQGKGSLALASDGGLYVSGYQRVVTYDPNGEPVSTWTPKAPMRRAVCELDGKPAVPVLNGVLRYETEAIGPQALADGTVGVITSEQEGLDRSMLLARSRIACTEDRAFVVFTYSAGPDSVFVYHVDGEVDRVVVPTEFSEEWGCLIAGRPCPPWTQNLRPSFDDLGNLVLFGSEWRTGGAIINLETGCYAIVKKNVQTDITRVPVRMKGDSILVFRDDQELTAGFDLYLGSANKVSIHPLRRVSGDPCPGLLPTVN